MASVEKLREEVAEKQLDNARRRLVTMPAEVHHEVPATSQTGRQDKGVEVDAFGGHLYIDSHGLARLDEDGALSLRKKVDQALQTGLRRYPTPEDDTDGDD